jgi:hypothetical protein
VRHGAVESVLVVLDGRGGVRATKRFADRVGVVALVDLTGDGREEIVVVRIEGTALSGLPTRWDVFRIGDGGTLVRVASIAKEDTQGVVEVVHRFDNLVTAPAPGVLRIETVRFAEEERQRMRGAPTRRGAVRSLCWSARSVRFVPCRL